MKFITLLFFLLLAAGCGQKKEKPSLTQDFEILMGKHHPAWQHIRTKEDRENLQFFREVFEKNIPLLDRAKQTVKIPKVLHFIWVGPKSFPIESVDNVRSWIGKNPDWKVKFWTDRDRPLPHPSMQKVLIDQFTFLKLERFFQASENFGEKSDLLRYEILFQEGGVYVDHDVKCLRSFDPLVENYDLFCGLELPFKTPLSSSVLPTNAILGSKPAHPVLSKVLDWLTQNWDGIEKDYPGKDRESVINRVSHRTFFALGENFKKFSNLGENRDIALPTFYFNAPSDELAIFARHYYAGSWFEKEPEFEKMVRKRLMMLSKKNNLILLGFGVFAGLQLAAAGFWIWSKQRADRKQ